MLEVTKTISYEETYFDTEHIMYLDVFFCDRNNYLKVDTKNEIEQFELALNKVRYANTLFLSSKIKK